MNRFDNGETFDQLFIAARSIDFEEPSVATELSGSKVKVTKNPVTSQQTTDGSDTLLREIMAEIRSLSQRIVTLESALKTQCQTRSDNGKAKQNSKDSAKSSRPAKTKNKSGVFCERCGRRGHPVALCHAKTDVEGNQLNW